MEDVGGGKQVEVLMAGPRALRRGHHAQPDPSTSRRVDYWVLTAVLGV